MPKQEREQNYKDMIEEVERVEKQYGVESKGEKQTWEEQY